MKGSGKCDCTGMVLSRVLSGEEVLRGYVSTSYLERAKISQEKLFHKLAAVQSQ